MRALAVLAGITLAATAAPKMAKAEDVAFVLTNTDYDEQRRAPEFGGELAGTLEAAGFRVVVVSDAGPRDIAERLAPEVTDLEAGDRLLIALSGHFVTGAGEAWLLGPTAEFPTLFDVGAMGVPVSAFLDAAARLPGEALVLVAPSGRDIETGTGLASGFVASDIPQGVTVFAGPAEAMTELLQERLLNGTETLAELAQDLPRGVGAQGFLPNARFFTSSEAGVASPTAAAGEAPEQAAWATASILNSEAGYARYLEQFPAGPNASTARDRLAALQEPDDVVTPENVEEALELDGETRQSIQRDLSILGYDTRGIDGIFGPGTRAAITDWQRARSFDATGFLTRDQIIRLEEQASARAAELEAEAAVRRAEQEALDQQAWAELSAAGTEGAYRTYLERFPDGHFAEEAATRLAEFEAAAAEAAAADDRAAWTNAREADAVQAYRGYLESFPQGQFAAAAQARIQELRGQNEQAQAAARAGEAQIIVNGAVALLTENQLAGQGFEPGPIDGQFDQATRRAIRRFQRDRGLEVTGFINQETAIQLLAGR